MTSANLANNKIKDASAVINDKRNETNLVVFLHDNEMDDDALKKLNQKLCDSNIILGPNKSEQSCVNQLTSFIEGSTAIKDKRNGRTYGSWNDMVNSYMAPKEPGVEDFIPRYKVVLFDIKPAIIDGDKVTDESTVTILAVPKEGFEYLRTFAITQNRVPLEWIGDYDLKDYSSLSLDNNKLWKKWPCGYYSGGYRACSDSG